LVGGSEQRCRYLKAKDLGGREIDDQLELGWLLDRQLGRFRPAQNLVDIVAGTPEQVPVVDPIGDETAYFKKDAARVDRGQPRAHRECVDAKAVGGYERAATHIKRLRLALERAADRGNIPGAPDSERVDDVEAERAGCCLYTAHLLYGPAPADIGQNRQPAQPGDNLMQKLKSLAGNIGLLG